MLRNRSMFILGLITLACLLIGPAVSAAAAEAKPELTDANIREAVSNQFLLDPGVRDRFIDLSVEAGIVKLEGTVGNLRSKERATRIAETIRGVRGVVNALEVGAGERSDEEIQSAIRTALKRDPATEPLEIESRVDDGTVTLSGTVDSWPEKQLAGAVAKQVRGVRGLDNQLQIDFMRERPDGEIRQEIERRLQNDVWVDADRIEVRVRHGAVVLSGKVGSAAEKTRARASAQISGVSDVTAGALTISADERRPMERSQQPRERSDEAIREAVEKALSYDPRVRTPAIRVGVEGGTVTLRGHVSNLQAKQAAGADAQHVTGVWRVDNRLSVRPDRVLPDDELTEQVVMALKENSYVERFDIDVRGRDGKVYLYGVVDSSFEKSEAGSAAARVHGVTAVANHLTVHYPSYAFPSVGMGFDNYRDYPNFDGRPYTPDLPFSRDDSVAKPDAEIRAAIKNQLYWNPMTPEDAITIEVTDAIATLAGTVPSWVARRAAIVNAYEGGARQVLDHLTVEGEPSRLQTDSER